MLINIREVSKSYGVKRLFHGLSLTMHRDECLGVVGPNGAGKTSLLKIAAGIEKPDGGRVERRRHLRVAYLAQEEEFQEGLTVRQALSKALSTWNMQEHELRTRVNVLSGKFGFEKPDLPAAHLSGGWRKRLSIATRVIVEPDLLLLDEPTNHLDLSGIIWLEDFVGKKGRGYVIVSHDRTFLERTADRIIEINPRYDGGCFSVQGGYSRFVEKRSALFAAQQRKEQALAGNVKSQLEWLKRGPRARATKDGSRKREAWAAIHSLEELRRRIAADARVSVDFASTGRRSKKLVSAENIGKSLGGRLLFSGLNLFLGPGTRLGIVGGNGTGKSTLLALLAGRMAPDSGTVKTAPDLKIALFDQERRQLDKSLTLRRALAPDSEMIEFNGKSVHVVSWAGKFLFPPERLGLKVSELSGGEQARVLIARLMSKPADLLLLDEPSNDLDIDSVEVLEEALVSFPGALVLITHDRALLDRVCTGLVGLHSDGGSGIYGEVAQWIAVEENIDRQRKAMQTRERLKPDRRLRHRLSRQERKELGSIEKKIAAAEENLARIEEELEKPGLASDYERLQELWKQKAGIEQAIENLYERWQELDDRASGER